MATIADTINKNSHNINRYDFKPLSLDIEDLEPIKDAKPYIKDESHIDTSEISQSSKDSLIESLLKKTDEMSSNFIKLQMKLESMSEEHKNELEKTKKESYESGIEAGLNEASKRELGAYANATKEFINSIDKLDKATQSFDASMDKIKQELVSVALDIAKEVIKVELSTNSNAVALSLANEIIDELRDSTNITLKVNPQDFAKISSSLSHLQNIKVVSSSAIAFGGVVALSDTSNIDAQIKKRFDRVKKVALGE